MFTLKTQEVPSSQEKKEEEEEEEEEEETSFASSTRESPDRHLSLHSCE